MLFLGFNEVFNVYYVGVVVVFEQSGQVLVLLQCYEFIQLFMVKVDVVFVGEMICVWILYLCEIFGQQEQVQWLGSSLGKVCVVLVYIW